MPADTPSTPNGPGATNSSAASPATAAATAPVCEPTKCMILDVNGTGQRRSRLQPRTQHEFEALPSRRQLLRPGRAGRVRAGLPLLARRAVRRRRPLRRPRGLLHAVPPGRGLRREVGGLRASRPLRRARGAVSLVARHARGGPRRLDDATINQNGFSRRVRTSSRTRTSSTSRTGPRRSPPKKCTRSRPKRGPRGTSRGSSAISLTGWARPRTPRRHRRPTARATTRRRLRPRSVVVS